MDSDSGRVDLPALVPHLEYRIIGKGQVLLVSETFNTLLHGLVYEDILPLLDRGGVLTGRHC